MNLFGTKNRASKNLSHITELDQLRGVAALMVVTAHVFHNFTRGVNSEFGDWLYPSNLFFSAIVEGHSGVALFMVLSGFLFSYAAFDKEVQYWGFIRNRTLRIFPLFLTILLLGTYTFPGNFSFESFLASLFFFSNTRAALDGGPFTILLWTISVEFMFYMIFPFLDKFRKQYGTSYLAVAMLTVFFLRLIAVGLGANARDFSYFTIFGRLDQFLLGMIAACICREKMLSNKLNPIFFVFSVFFVLTSLSIFNHLGGWIVIKNWKIIWPTWEGVMYSTLVITYLNTDLPKLFNFLGKIFSAIGVLSYSVYLLHQPILTIFQNKKWFFTNACDTYCNVSLTWIIVIPVILCASYFTYFCIELPFLSMRGRYLLNYSEK